MSAATVSTTRPTPSCGFTIAASPASAPAVTQRPQHVEESRRIVGEVARLVEGAGAVLSEALRPGHEGSDVAREPGRGQVRDPECDAGGDDDRDREARARDGHAHSQYPRWRITA